MDNPSARIESIIDTKTVGGIPYDRSITIINSFILKSVEFLNTFSFHCESQLQTVSNRLARLEALLCLLESKLDSVPNLPNPPEDESSVTVSSQDISSTSDPTNVSADPSLPPPPDGDIPPLPPSIDGSGTGESGGEPTGEPQGVLVENDPRLKPYFTQLKYGVVEFAVKQKMESDGFDPSLLDMQNVPVSQVEHLFPQ